MPSTPASQPASILLIEPEKSLALKLQDLLVSHFETALLNRLPAEEPARVCSEQITMAGIRAAALLKSLAPFHKPASSVMPANSVFTVEPGPILSSN